MGYTALENCLQRRVISPVYLFYGEETYLRDQYAKKFQDLLPAEVRDFNLDIVDGRETTIDSIINLATTLPFMSEYRVVIVKNADVFKNRRTGPNENGDPHGEKSNPADETLINYLENPLDTTCLVFCADSADKKSKIYKSIEKHGQVVEFLPLKGRELTAWIERKARELGKTIEPPAIGLLVTAVGNNLNQLQAELEKLSCYSCTGKITVSDVEFMVSKTAEISIFDLVDSVGERNYKKAIRMAREMIVAGEAAARILFMIARQFRLIIRAKVYQQMGYAEKQITGQLQVHPFAAQKCIKQARNFSLPELKMALEKVLSADSDIKSGRQEPNLALELLIIALCEKESKKGR